MFFVFMRFPCQTSLAGRTKTVHWFGTIGETFMADNYFFHESNLARNITPISDFCFLLSTFGILPISERVL